MGADERYVDLGLIGVGGMGEVRRVQDTELHRVVAMKRVRADVNASPTALARFVDEVQATAQLQHPGIVPVYDTGRTADGAVWFTMKEVRGRTLTEVIREVHGASVERWETTPDGWNLRRLVTVVHQASQAVGYAHERGVVHRDLKPDNVMVGTHGEVQVMDWGLCKIVGRDDPETEAIFLERARDATIVGRVMGTPSYMAPEQARGDLAAIDARTDVYALGAMLYEVLAGRAPYGGRTWAEIVANVRSGPPPAPSQATRSIEGAAPTAGWGDEEPAAEPAPIGPAGGWLPIPEDLELACAKAMARDPAQRYPTAAAFAADLAAWLDGSRRREVALAVVAQAEALGPEAQTLLSRAAALRAEAKALLAGIPAPAPEDVKAPGWAREDEAEALERRAGLVGLRREELLRGALTHAPDLAEAHAALVELELERHAAAEAVRDAGGVARSELRLDEHVPKLPAGHPVAERAAAWLRGQGALTLRTDPEGAEVQLFRYELRLRRLVEVPVRTLRSPVRDLPLPMGSYLCVLRHPGRAEVRYPVLIGRGERWEGAPRLPLAAEIGSEDCYVAEGWYWCGGDPGAANAWPRERRWVDAFVVRRFPVTNREYLAFLDDLVATGREAEALEHAPRERAGTAGEHGALIYGFDGRSFSLRPDADGDLWEPDHPVVMVSWRGATAFAEWTGPGWRLPTDDEREKAARGVDGRIFPWGDRYDPSWACSQWSHTGRARLQPVDSFPVDCSVYGARGMAGNTMEWCADVFRLPDGSAYGAGTVRVLRGGSWSIQPINARIARRGRLDPGHRNHDVGFRLARSV
jgi:serine/threonine protein kinase/formylglycine-generating enzyme required for sulfatase activity